MQKIQNGDQEPLERLRTNVILVIRCTASQRQSSLCEDGYGTAVDHEQHGHITHDMRLYHAGRHRAWMGHRNNSVMHV
jgi:hypothetical protein